MEGNRKNGEIVQEEQEKEIVSIPAIEEVEIDDEFVKRLEKNIDAYKRIVTLAIRLTNDQDWTSQQGKPYLDASGAEKIANPFGVQIRSQRSKRLDYEDNIGSYYIWEYTAEFSSMKLARSIEISGMASSRDKFFAKISSFVDGKKVAVLKPTEEVDQTMIMRKAQTNMIVNGIKRLLGLRNLTWDQLREAGVDTKKIVPVTYQTKPKQELTEIKPTPTPKKESLFK